jgi:hypothetical protein
MVKPNLERESSWLRGSVRKLETEAVGWLATEWSGRPHILTGEACLEMRAEFMFAQSGHKSRPGRSQSLRSSEEAS